jgi:hypothetical protein
MCNFLKFFIELCQPQIEQIDNQEQINNEIISNDIQNKDTNIYSYNNDINNILLEGNNLIIQNESGNLFRDDIIKLNERGLINSNNKISGITKFGPNKLYDNNEPINDYILNYNNSIDTLFTIKFNNENKKYFIFSDTLNENNSDSNLFLKITNKLKIIDKDYYISLGEIHLKINTNEFDSEKINILITYEDNISKEYNYDKTKKKITIGRENCDIPLNKLNYSRIQCTIIFDEIENCWFFYDGNGEKESMNGCWIFLNFNWEINDNIILRIGANIFKILLENENIDNNK